MCVCVFACVCAPVCVCLCVYVCVCMHVRVCVRVRVHIICVSCFTFFVYLCMYTSVLCVCECSAFPYARMSIACVCSQPCKMCTCVNICSKTHVLACTNAPSTIIDQRTCAHTQQGYTFTLCTYKCTTYAHINGHITFKHL